MALFGDGAAGAIVTRRRPGVESRGTLGGGRRSTAGQEPLDIHGLRTSRKRTRRSVPTAHSAVVRQRLSRRAAKFPREGRVTMGDSSACCWPPGWGEGCCWTRWKTFSVFERDALDASVTVPAPLRQRSEPQCCSSWPMVRRGVFRAGASVFARTRVLRGLQGSRIADAVPEPRRGRRVTWPSASNSSTVSLIHEGGELARGKAGRASAPLDSQDRRHVLALVSGRTRPDIRRMRRAGDCSVVVTATSK